MLKKLQRKFVMLTTAISVVVMLLIAVTINVVNYMSIMNNSDEVLDLLVQGDLKMGESFAPRGKFPAEIAFTTRFFTVRTNENDIIDHVDTRNISYVSPGEAIEYVATANESGEDAGIIGNFRYIKSENQLGHIYFFLDIEEDLIGFETYMYYSVLILVGAIISIFILSALLSKKAVAPIADSYERQKGFITNVSHEFKTPLAIIKADCDVIEIDNGEGEWTGSIKKQISRLDKLVENLISLTKLDEETELIKTDFSISDAIHDIVNEFSAATKSSGLSVVLDIEKNITYNGDEQHIRNLVAILAENAVKYALQQTNLQFNLHGVGSKKIFSVENSCEDVEIGKHNEWFERFYRGDESRNSQTKGYGIGLSIAKTICDLHGAKISAESKTGKEIIITVIF